MKRIYFLIVVSLMCCMELTALDWPADNQDFLRLFGQRIGADTFEQGITFEHSEIVRAADDGTLLIALNNRYRAGAFPSTLGNALIFLHDDGLQTVYGNLDTTASFRNRTTADAGAALGRTGNSGWGTPHHLLFQVRDNSRNVYINPLLLLPGVADKTAPQIQNIILMNERNTAISAASVKTVRQGSYELYADISDTTAADGHHFSPFRINVFVNGTNIRTIPFETISHRDEAAYLGSTAFTDALLYRRPDTLYLGKIILNRGKTDLLITARDITGNEKAERCTLQVD